MKKLILIGCVALLAACGGKVPTDAQLNDLYTKLYNDWRATAEAEKETVYQKTIDEISEFDIEKIQPAQCELLLKELDHELETKLRYTLLPIYTKQAATTDLDGAQAALNAMSIAQKLLYNGLTSDQQAVESYKTAINHPVLGELITQKPVALQDIISKMSAIGVDKLAEAGLVEPTIALLDLPLSDESIGYSSSLFEVVFAGKTVSNETKNIVREKVVAMNRQMIDGGALDDKKRAKVEELIAYLEGPYATQTLIGNTAPEIDFLWSSAGGAKKLSDYKGKVVMIDFWATKCGPCVAIFPNVRALATRYKGFPVEIVGVTSIHGYHVDIKNGKTIRTDNDPQREISLMPGFMKDMEMNWGVAFSSGSVYDNNYGVKGIPHITIIDANGVVRYNGIDPDEAPYMKAEKIDALLKEAGLPAPKAAMATQNYKVK